MIAKGRMISAGLAAGAVLAGVEVAVVDVGAAAVEVGAVGVTMVVAGVAVVVGVATVGAASVDVVREAGSSKSCCCRLLGTRKVSADAMDLREPCFLAWWFGAGRWWCWHGLFLHGVERRLHRIHLLLEGCEFIAELFNH